jgi:hypothetical protein
VTEAELLIDAARLSYPDVSGGAAALPITGTYEYAADRFDAVSGSFLFWGPYLDLKAGVYVVDFIGEVEGRFSVEFIHNGGKMRVKQTEFDNFDAPACVVLLQAVEKFEIRGQKTRALRRLRLEGIRLRCVYPGAGAR